MRKVVNPTAKAINQFRKRRNSLVVGCESANTGGAPAASASLAKCVAVLYMFDVGVRDIPPRSHRKTLILLDVPFAVWRASCMNIMRRSLDAGSLARAFPLEAARIFRMLRED